MARGGKRVGAGAPKGNMNGFKHGRRSRKDFVREFTATLDDQQLAAFEAVLRENKHQLPGFEDLADDKPRLVAFAPAREPARNLLTHTETLNQPIREDARLERERRIAGLLQNMNRIGWLHADAFIDNHRPVLGHLERAFLDLHLTEENAPETLARVDSKVALVREGFHARISQRVGRKKQCPYCGWTQSFMVLPDPALEDEDAYLDDAMQQEAK